MSTRKEILEQIKARFEAEIKYALAVYKGQGGYIEDDEEEDIERFEILNVAEEQYDKFLDVVSEIRRKLVKPNGFSISVHALSPESTLKHRSKEFRIEKLKRSATAPFNKIRESWDQRRVDQVHLVGLGSTIVTRWEMVKEPRNDEVQHVKFKTKESKIRECDREDNRTVQWNGNGSAPAELQSCWPEAA